MILLSGDWHLDEDPDNEYRWGIFGQVRKLVLNRDISHVYCLGDMLDRKDRFSAQFVNRLVAELKETGSLIPFSILRGNHDTPLRGPAFFEFANDFPFDIKYISEPTPRGRLILLPHTVNPAEAWRGIAWRDFHCALMHVTIAGAITENGFKLTAGQRLPLLPRHLKLYSGDIHTPQIVRNITYVGAPHPVKFGDRYPCRVLLLDENTFEIAEEVELPATRKHVIEISSLDELPTVKPGDRAKIRFRLPSEQIDKWGEIEQQLTIWARDNGIEIAGTEVIIEGGARELDLDMAPEQLLREFAESEGISKDLLADGLSLLKFSL